MTIRHDGISAKAVSPLRVDYRFLDFHKWIYSAKKWHEFAEHVARRRKTVQQQNSGFIRTPRLSIKNVTLSCFNKMICHFHIYNSKFKTFQLHLSASLYLNYSLFISSKCSSAQPIRADTWGMRD